jgi:hypothetical protein
LTLPVSRYCYLKSSSIYNTNYSKWVIPYLVLKFPKDLQLFYYLGFFCILWGLLWYFKLGIPWTVSICRQIIRLHSSTSHYLIHASLSTFDHSLLKWFWSSTSFIFVRFTTSVSHLYHRRNKIAWNYRVMISERIKLLKKLILK